MAKSLNDFVAEALQTVSEITPEDMAQNLFKSSVLILDVREPDEFAAGHLPGAINVPRGFLEVKADLEHHKRDERLANREQAIACYCGGGFRSALAAKTLQEMGFSDVTSMAGGWTAWIERSLPVERPKASGDNNESLVGFSAP